MTCQLEGTWVPARGCRMVPGHVMACRTSELQSSGLCPPGRSSRKAISLLSELSCRGTEERAPEIPVSGELFSLEGQQEGKCREDLTWIKG